MADDKRAGFIAGCPRRARNEGESFWAFLLDWIASLFRVDQDVNAFRQIERTTSR